MKIYVLLIPAVVMLAILATGCSKNSDPIPPDEEVLDDTITFPHVMFSSLARHRTPRIFANGHELFDSAYAETFVLDATTFYFYNANPPKKIQFESKDTLGVFYNTEPSKFGIHKDGDVEHLYSLYPVGPVSDIDTNMTNYTINAQTGMAYPVLTAYGDYKEYVIPVFAYKLAHYKKDNYDSTKTYASVSRISWKLSEFKDSYMSTLGPLDTFAVQEYEMVFRKR